MKKVLLIFLFVVVIGLFGWTMIFLYGKSQEKPITYTTETPQLTTIVQKTVATGSIIPRKEIALKPVVSGIIKELYVEAGEVVEAGRVVARIQVIPDMVNLSNAENRLQRAEIALENAKIDYDRNKVLLDQEVISRADFLPVDLSYKNALSELDAAKENLIIVREGVSGKAGAATNTTVKSTISGMILDVPVKEGSSVIEANNFNEGTTIATVADMKDLIFEGKVDEAEVGKIKEGMELILSIGAMQEDTFIAKLEYISPKGVEENGAIQFQIRAAVKLKDNEFIRAGYSANADVVLARRENVLAINEGLLQFSNDTPFVEIATGPQEFERRNVKLGLSDGIMVEILSGLQESDSIKVWNKTVPSAS